MKSFDIKIGKGRGALTLDAAKLVEGRCLIQGASGSGKSYLARVIAEQTIPKGLQTILLDSEGEFLSLREKCDFLIAGKEGDVPCEVRSAKLLARRIAETGVSAVVDMSDLKLDERRKFVRIFLETLDALPKKLERPRLVVLDEVHKYAPEAGKGKAESTEAVISLMSQGRKRGLAGVLLTQRLSKLKKDAAAEAANVFIGKTSPIDLHSAQDMLGVVKEDREALRTLTPGEFYATGPAVNSGDSSVDVMVFQARKAITTHPEPGSRYKMSTPPPRAVIQKLLHEFEALPPSKEAEEAQNLADAKARIRELERELRKIQVVKPAAEGAAVYWASKGIDPKEYKVLQKDYVALQKAVKAFKKVVERRESQLKAQTQRLRNLFPKLVKRLMTHISELQEVLETELQHDGVERRPILPPLPELEPAQLAHPVHPVARRRPTPRVAPDPPARPSAAGTTRQGVTKTGSRAGSGFDRMLYALAQHRELEKAKLAIMAGISSKTGTFRNYVSRGKMEGLWEVDSSSNEKAISITETGIETAGRFDPLPEGNDLVDYWCRHKAVPTRAGEMLRFICENGGDGATKAEIADFVGIQQNTGTFRNYLSRLHTLGLIERGNPIIAAESLRAW